MPDHFDSRQTGSPHRPRLIPPDDDHKEVKRALIGTAVAIAAGLIATIALLVSAVMVTARFVNRTPDAPTVTAAVLPVAQAQAVTVTVTQSPAPTMTRTPTPIPSASPTRPRSTATLSPTATETPLPTPTSIYDFGSGCIATILWEPLEETVLYKHRAGGCWIYEDKGNFAPVQNEGLNLTGILPRRGLRSFYTPLNAPGEVRFKVKVNALSSLNAEGHAFAFAGVGPKYDFYTKGQFLLFGGTQDNQLSLFQSDSYFNPGESVQGLAAGQWVNVRFVLDGQNVTIEAGGWRKSLTLPERTAAKPYFFVGVGAPWGGALDVLIKDFEIVERK